MLRAVSPFFSLLFPAHGRPSRHPFISRPIVLLTWTNYADRMLQGKEEGGGGQTRPLSTCRYTVKIGTLYVTPTHKTYHCQGCHRVLKLFLVILSSNSQTNNGTFSYVDQGLLGNTYRNLCSSTFEEEVTLKGLNFLFCQLWLEKKSCRHLLFPCHIAFLFLPSTSFCLLSQPCYALTLHTYIQYSTHTHLPPPLFPA